MGWIFFSEPRTVSYLSFLHPPFRKRMSHKTESSLRYILRRLSWIVSPSHKKELFSQMLLSFERPHLNRKCHKIFWPGFFSHDSSFFTFIHPLFTLAVYGKYLIVLLPFPHAVDAPHWPAVAVHAGIRLTRPVEREQNNHWRRRNKRDYREFVLINRKYD